MSHRPLSTPSFILESISDAIIYTDLNLSIISWNPAAEHIYGWNAKEVIGESFPTFLQTTFLDGSSFDEAFAELQRKGKWSGEVEQKTKEGKRLYIFSSVTSVRDESGAFLGAIAVNRDITDQRQTEARLHRTRDVLQAVIKAAPAAIITLDLQGNVVSWNPAAEKIFGWKESEVLGGQLPYVPPEKQREFRNFLERVAGGESFANVESRRMRRDGTPVDVSISTAPLHDAKGNVAGIMAVVSDVTGVNAAQRERERFFTLSADMLGIIGSDGHIKHANEVWTRILGWTMEELVAHPWSEFIHPDDLQNAMNIGADLAAGKAVRDFENRIRCKDGSYRWLSWNAFTDKESGLMFVEAHDTTEQRITRKQLELSEERYKRLADSFPAGTVNTYDRDLRITFVTGRDLQKDNLDPSMFIGKTLWEIAPPETCAIAEPHFRAAFKGEHRRYETPYFDDRYYEVLVSPVYEVDGTIREILVVSHNITERKQSEKNLRDSEHRYRELVELSPYGLFIQSRGVIVFANKAASAVFGFNSPDALVGRNVLDLVHPDSRADVMASIEALRNGVRLEAPVERKILQPDGSFIFAEAFAVPIMYNGIPSAQVIIQNITERRIADQKLKRSEKLLADAQRIAQLGSWELDIPRNHLYWSDEIYRIFGLKRKDFEETYEAFLERVHPDDREIMAKAQRAALAGEKPLDLEHRIVRPDGDVRIVREVGNLLPDETGNLSRLVGIVQDITEQVQVRRRLEESEKKYRGIIETAREGVWLFDSEGKTTLVNKALLSMFGYTENEMMHQPFTEFVHAESRQDAVEYLDRCRRGIREMIDIRFMKKDGSDLWCLLNAGPVTDEQGKFLGALAMLTDITERRVLLERLKFQATLVENITDALISTDLEDTVLAWNPAAALMYDIPPEDAIGKKLIGLLDKEFIGVTRDEMRRELMRKGTWRGEMVQRTGSGKTLYVLSSKSLLHGAEGTVTGIVTINRDITLRKQAEDEIRRLNEELEQRVQERTAQLLAANNELEAFSYSVSHDLRAPLRAVDGYARILLEEHLNEMTEEGRNIAREVRSGAQRMGKLIDDLLAFSRAGRTSLQPHPIDMKTLARSVFYELTAPEKRSRVDFVIEDMPPAMGDPTLIRLVWTNLLSNALKFTSKVPRPRIEIGGRIQDQETVYFVRDNGAGFDMRYYDKLFGVFQRLHSTRDFTGTGVGLAIVQRIIHRHYGRVFAEGSIGEGATFTFTIPVTPP